jgi:hypothetical protein
MSGSAQPHRRETLMKLVKKILSGSKTDKLLSWEDM